MLWTVNLCIFLFAGFFMDCVSAGEQCRVERSINGMALQGFVFKKFLVRAFHECDFSCEKEITCQSYNYVKWEKSCELNNRTKEARPENFRSDPARSYIRRLMERDVDECLNGIHDCDANANCINTVGGHNCSCKEGFAGDGRSCSAYKNNCAEIYKSGERKDGVYTIKPDNLSAFDVFCDQTTAGGGWTVFQKRLNGSVDFFLNWSDYKVGFGDLNGEFWLGLDKIHRLTSDNDSMLRVDLEDFERNTSYAEYNRFGVMSENDKYKLSFGNYSGRKVFFIILHCTGCPNLAA
ncbi:angiopoietin-2-like isoform X2 [Orbicella faveolata]|uniref:angiopoietin-2-like isoform X2 n=1 Tax=Orbicella faveolata TaxID=48498 RepID=UPI0009E4BA00|nr:angiopoietin-2-like isoform X2 [Orbicella faveolata]